eukprot:5187061-Prymnesium_polylepis.1
MLLFGLSLACASTAPATTAAEPCSGSRSSRGLCRQRLPAERHLHGTRCQQVGYCSSQADMATNQRLTLR